MVLPIRRNVNVTVELSPLPIAGQNFSTSLIIGDTPVILADQLIRFYSSIEEIGEDFSLTDPEYKAAEVYFSQVPQPGRVGIGAWYPSGGAAALMGSSAAQTSIPAWAAITTGSFAVSVDGASPVNITGLDFSSATTLTAVCTVVNTALTTATIPLVLSYDTQKLAFVLKHSTIGSTHSIAPLTPAGAGTDISSLLALDASNARVVPGMDAQTPVQAVAALVDKDTTWYSCSFASTQTITDDEYLDCAALIEALSVKRLFGITTQEVTVLDSASSVDIASKLAALKYIRTITMYSSTNPYAVMTIFGRMVTVEFESANSTITLKFKQAPGIVSENISTSQADALQKKNCNVFANYGASSIIQEGVVASGEFIDTIANVDWIANSIQIAEYNVLYTALTKIPQTDEGVNLLVAAISSVLETARANGSIGPGVWNAQGFGKLKQGDTLGSGYYIYAMPLDTQNETDRALRKAPPILVAIKLQGAIHFVDVTIKVNR